jgi:hypothetical protein
LGALHYWESTRGARDIPARRDIDPTEIAPELLPYLMLLDVTDAGAGFRVRLAGTAVVARCGRDATGMRSDEFLSGAPLSYIISLVQEACRLRRPIYSEALHLPHDTGELLTKRLLLPLTGGDTDVTMILMALDYGPSPPNAKARAPLSCPELREISRSQL